MATLVTPTPQEILAASRIYVLMRYDRDEIAPESKILLVTHDQNEAWDHAKLEVTKALPNSSLFRFTIQIWVGGKLETEGEFSETIHPSAMKLYEVMEELRAYEGVWKKGMLGFNLGTVLKDMERAFHHIKSLQPLESYGQ